MSQTDIETLHARLEQAEEELEQLIPDAAVSKPLRSEDVQRLVQSIDVERFVSLPTQAARVRAIYSAFGEGAEFRPGDVVRAYQVLDAGMSAPNLSQISDKLARDAKKGLLARLERGLWRVLCAPVEVPALDVERLVQSIDVGEFASLPTEAARIRAIHSAFGEGTEFRAGDVVRAYEALDSGAEVPDSEVMSVYLHTAMKTGMLAKLERGLWYVLRAQAEPRVFDMASLVQNIDVERFVSLPTHAARVRAIYSAFGEGAEFRPSDVVRAYRVLNTGNDDPGPSTLSNQLVRDAKAGRLAKLERGLWRVLRVQVEVPVLEDVPLVQSTDVEPAVQLVQSIDVGEFASLPTEAARIRAVYAAFGEGAKFRASDVVSVLNRSGVVAPTVASIQRVLEEDVEAGKLERVESGLWKVVDANHCDDITPSGLPEEVETQQPKRPGARRKASTRPRASQEPLDRSEGAVDNESLGARVERLCEVLGERGRVFDWRDVEQAFEREGTSVSLVMRTKLFVKLDALLTRGFLEAVDRNDWGTFRLATP